MRLDVLHAAHQCARFSSDPKQAHIDAVKWLCRYLKGTKDKGMTWKPDFSKYLEVWVDADFVRNWDKDYACNNIDTARSRFGYIISYANSFFCFFIIIKLYQCP